MLQEVLDVSSIGMNTCVRMTSTKGLVAFEHPGYGVNLVCCILYAFPKLLSGVSSVGANHILHVTAQVNKHLSD
jgi:hypothetical protein